jgi:hypothetical protein
VLGVDTTKVFRKVRAELVNTPPLMTEMIRWIYRPRSQGGDGKEKNGNDPNFTKSGPAIWTYDYNRRKVEYYYDDLNCSYSAGSDLSAAGTDGRIIGDPRWSFNGVITSVGNSVSPSKFSLNQNYPNPFNPSTSFTYELSKAGFVSVKVFDLLGREVATLVNEFKQAGSYPATWNATDFGSGVYFYKMQSGSFTSTKKMILMK